MTKNKIALAAFMLLVGCAWLYAATRYRETGEGLWLGRTGDKIGFWGTTPTNQPVVTNTTPQAFTVIGPTAGTTADVVTNVTLTLQSGPILTNVYNAVTNVFQSVTNVTVAVQTRAVFADVTGTATNTFAAFTSTNQMLQILRALHNTGLASQ